VQSPHLAGSTELLLRSNLVELPKDAQTDPAALRRHFRLRDALAQVPGSTVRCMLVGAPHAGKTTLARLLVGEDQDWAGLARTLGV
jgi:polynucleotide 5'-kinase involved in rRNA processing